MRIFPFMEVVDFRSFLRKFYAKYSSFLNPSQILFLKEYFHRIFFPKESFSRNLLQKTFSKDPSPKTFSNNSSQIICSIEFFPQETFPKDPSQKILPSKFLKNDPFFVTLPWFKYSNGIKSGRRN